MRGALYTLAWVVSSLVPLAAQSQTPAAPPAPSPEVQEAMSRIDSSHAAYIKAFGDGNADEVVAVYDSGATELLAKGRAVHGLSALHEYWGGWIKSVGRIKLSLVRDEFWLLGDRAFETGRYTTGYKKKDGTDGTVGGNFAIQWKRQGDGSWKILNPFDTPK